MFIYLFIYFVGAKHEENESDVWKNGQIKNIYEENLFYIKLH